MASGASGRYAPPPKISVKELLKKRKGIESQSNLTMQPVTLPAPSMPEVEPPSAPITPQALEGVVIKVLESLGVSPDHMVLDRLKPKRGTGRRPKPIDIEKRKDDKGERRLFLVSNPHAIHQ
jgi:hypothetical protein